MTTADASAIPDYMDRLRLDGKNFIVLGAGMGMGRQSTHALTQAGARVFCVDVDRVRAEEIAKEVKGIAWATDCTKRPNVEALVAEAKRVMGRIDGIVDIVGLATYRPILDTDDAAWDSQFDIVLRHAYLISTIAGREMKASGGGTMVFIASISGMSGAPDHAVYGAAKAGLMSWVQSLALELAPFGIRANAVAPGIIYTPRMQAAMSAEKVADYTSRVPMGRLGETPDIAGAVLFFSSPLSGYVTGRTIVVDGGLKTNFPLRSPVSPGRL
jgi:NAD(P)-dependent dehydrogenase (short-subunit alcohol dehydrogenase family)